VQLLQPSSAEEATAALGNGARALAGGTELVPLLRDGLIEASTLVELRHAVPRGIDGTRIGAGTTLAELEIDPQVPEALREACRLLDFPCYLHGGDRCHAKEGQQREHAIFGNETCASAHPSDIAAALLALGTTLRTTARELPLAELYRLPTPDDPRTTTLATDELILELDVPTPDRSVYLKAMDRQRWSFPIVGVAAASFGDETRLALAGVAPIPWALASAADLDAATPLPGTAYKLPIARALVRRALEGVSPR
jgi:xanthine dehydrogenase YagS FAD-binding subunit